MTTQIAVPEVEVEKIDVVEGFNSRQEMDPVELERMAATIRAQGVVQPIKVRERDDGRFDLVYGHRRLAAAKLAGLTRVPVSPSTGNARVEAFYENNQRSDLNPIERALDLKAFAEELGLAKHKDIAAAAGKSPDWVGEHLRLLKLPEEVQRYLAAGIVPVEGEKPLRELTKVSPGIAACVCELAKRRKVKPSRFVSAFGDLLAEAPGSRFEEKPTMIPVSGARLGEIVTDAEKHEELLGRWRAALPHGGDGDPVVRFGEQQVDAARAAGCLVEHEVDEGEWTSWVRLITDAELAADLCERMITGLEAQAAERAKREAEWRAGSDTPAEAATPEEQAQARKDQRAEAEKRKVAARSRNEEVGRRLIERRGGKNRRQHSLTRFKVMARALVEANPKLAARGLRLVLPQLREVESKTLKSGEPREKVTYADAAQAHEWLLAHLDSVGSVNEGLELLADAYIAAILADEGALPQSGRTWGAEPAKWVTDALAAEVKAVRPPRRSGKRLRKTVAWHPGVPPPLRSGARSRTGSSSGWPCRSLADLPGAAPPASSGPPCSRPGHPRSGPPGQPRPAGAATDPRGQRRQR
ncbi:MAG: ParB/RepB/Spo0J family partition protein [Solirubrobacterales bacterium]